MKQPLRQFWGAIRKPRFEESLLLWRRCAYGRNFSCCPPESHFLITGRAYDILFDPVGEIAARHDRIAERHAVPIMSGKEKTWGLRLNVIHQFAVAAKTDVVLRNCAWIKDAVLESGFAAHAQQY